MLRRFQVAARLARSAPLARRHHGSAPRSSIVALLAAALLLPIAAPRAAAQNWTALVDGGLGLEDLSTRSVTTPDGGLCMFGTLNPWSPGSGPTDALLIKLDRAGNVAWQVTWDGPAASSDQGSAIAVAPDGDLFVAITSYDLATSLDWVIQRRRGSDGALLWQQRLDRFGGLDQPIAIGVDPFGDVVATGYGSNRKPDPDVWTVKLSASGTVLWKSVYQGPGPLFMRSDSGQGIAFDPSGDVVLACLSSSIGGDSDVVSMRLRASDGTRVWLERWDFGNGVHEWIDRIARAPDGSFVGHGRLWSGADWDLLTIKLAAADGAVVWHVEDDAAVDETPGGFAIDANGDLLIAATSDPNGDASDGNHDIWCAKHQGSDGALIWQQRIGTSVKFDYHAAIDCVLEPEGDLLLVGYHETVSTARELIVQRLEGSDGSLGWSASYRNPLGYSPLIQSLRFTEGHVVVAASDWNGSDTDFAALDWTVESVLPATSGVVRRGRRLGGSFAHLAASDDVRLHLRTARPWLLGVPEIELELRATAPAPGGELALELEAAMSGDGGRVEIDYLDRSSGSWTTVHAGPLAAADRTLRLARPGAAYIDPTTLEIAARLRFFPGTAWSSRPALALIDRCVWWWEP